MVIDFFYLLSRLYTFSVLAINLINPLTVLTLDTINTAYQWQDYYNPDTCSQYNSLPDWLYLQNVFLFSIICVVKSFITKVKIGSWQHQENISHEFSDRWTLKRVILGLGSLLIGQYLLTPASDWSFVHSMNILRDELKTDPASTRQTPGSHNKISVQRKLCQNKYVYKSAPK